MHGKLFSFIVQGVMEIKIIYSVSRKSSKGGTSETQCFSSHKWLESLAPKDGANDNKR